MQIFVYNSTNNHGNGPVTTCPTAENLKKKRDSQNFDFSDSFAQCLSFLKKVPYRELR